MVEFANCVDGTGCPPWLVPKYVRNVPDDGMLTCKCMPWIHNDTPPCIASPGGGIGQILVGVILIGIGLTLVRNFGRN